MNTITKKPNSNDVARGAGVSRATVSYVFNGRKNGISVPEATRERVLSVARTIGYKPDRTARALKTGRNHTIAVWTWRIYPPIYSSFLQQFHDFAQENNYHLIITDSAEYDNAELFNLPVDGVIAVDKQEQVNAIREREEDLPFPIVSVGAYYSTAFDYVGVDLYSGAREVLAHLHAQGRKRIAYYCHNQDYSRTVEKVARLMEGSARSIIMRGGDARFAAYLDFCHEEKVEPIVWDFAVTSRREVQTLLRAAWAPLGEKEKPDALFCVNDSVAIASMRALWDMGIAVPEQVAVVGCDGTEEAEYVRPSLTTLVQPVEEVCRRAWELLRHRIESPGGPAQSIVLPAHVVIRESTGALARNETPSST